MDIQYVVANYVLKYFLTCTNLESALSGTILFKNLFNFPSSLGQNISGHCSINIWVPFFKQILRQKEKQSYFLISKRFVGLKRALENSIMLRIKKIYNYKTLLSNPKRFLAYLHQFSSALRTMHQQNGNRK